MFLGRSTMGRRKSTPQHTLQQEFLEVTPAIQYTHDAHGLSADAEEDPVRGYNQFAVLRDAQLSELRWYTTTLRAGHKPIYPAPELLVNMNRGINAVARGDILQDFIEIA
jgi:hypothetical protein